MRPIIEFRTDPNFLIYMPLDRSGSGLIRLILSDGSQLVLEGSVFVNPFKPSRIDFKILGVERGSDPPVYYKGDYNRSLQSGKLRRLSVAEADVLHRILSLEPSPPPLWVDAAYAADYAKSSGWPVAQAKRAFTALVHHHKMKSWGKRKPFRLQKVGRGSSKLELRSVMAYLERSGTDDIAEFGPKSEQFVIELFGHATSDSSFI